MVETDFQKKCWCGQRSSGQTPKIVHGHLHTLAHTNVYTHTKDKKFIHETMIYDVDTYTSLLKCSKPRILESRNGAMI